MDGKDLAASLIPDAIAKTVLVGKALLWAAIACLLSLLVGAGSGIWLGIEWQQGRHAQARVAQVERDYTALEGALQDDRRLYQSAYSHAAQDMRTAAVRLEQIAISTEDLRDENKRHAREVRGLLEAELARRPDLSAVHIGDGLLCAWNRAAVGADPAGGPGIAAAAPLPGCQPAAAVPEPGAGAGRQPADAPAAPAADRRR